MSIKYVPICDCCKKELDLSGGKPTGVSVTSGLSATQLEWTSDSKAATVSRNLQLSGSNYCSAPCLSQALDEFLDAAYPGASTETGSTT